MLHPPPDLESPILDTSKNTKVGQKIGKIFKQGIGNDRFSGDGFSEIDSFIGTKTSLRRNFIYYMPDQPV